MSSAIQGAIRDYRHAGNGGPHGKTPYGLALAEDCASKALQSNDSIAMLSGETLAILDQIARPVTYPEGAVVFVEGQTPRGVFVLCQGQAKLTSTNRDGKTFIMSIAQPGEILGLQAVILDGPHELTMETLQPSQLAFVECAPFRRFIKDHADACLYVVQRLTHDCQSAYDVIRSVALSQSVSERVARLLLEWSGDSQLNKDAIRFNMPLTHEEIGQRVGATRETVTRVLSEFKKRQLLEQHGATLVIRNKVGLANMA